MAGRLVVTATPALALGESGLLGVSESPTPGGRADRLGFEGVYRDGPNQLRGEYMRGRDGEQRRDGWYILGTRDLSAEWKLVARYDTFDPDRSRPSDEQTDLLVGFTRFIERHNAKVQLNLVRNQRGAAAGQSGEQAILNCQVAY